MSVVRWGPTSDVYIFFDVAGGITCCDCDLAGEPTARFNVATVDEMRDHMRAHVAAGDDVPASAFDQLDVEAADCE